MTTIGIDLGWRNSRVVVLNKLSELIPIPAAESPEQGSLRAGITSPLVASPRKSSPNRGVEGQEHIVGNDALFCLDHPEEWTVRHALASAAEGESSDDRGLADTPLIELLEKLKEDLEFSGYAVGGRFSADVRITTDTLVPSATLKRCAATAFPEARFVPRFEAARAYSRLLLGDETGLSRLKDNREPANSVVLDIGFHSQTVTVHQNGQQPGDNWREASIAPNLKPGSAFPEFLRTNFLIAAFGSWCSFVAEALGTHEPGIVNAFRSANISEREIYRHFDGWWKQVLPSTHMAEEQRNSRIAPFMLPAEVNPGARPFIGCMPTDVLSSITDRLWDRVAAKFNGFTPMQGLVAQWMRGAPLILIGQYSDVPQIGNGIAQRLQQLLRNLPTADQTASLRVLRLPPTGLAAGAAMAADIALRG